MSINVSLKNDVVLVFVVQISDVALFDLPLSVLLVKYRLAGLCPIVPSVSQ